MEVSVPTNEVELKTALHQMLLSHTTTMHEIQQQGFQRFMRIANVQLQAIDRVLEDKSQGLATEVAKHV